MYRILIIDDEPIVREGISNTIDWQSHGFELVGTCRDGREGLNAFDELRPDVVITDICMPFVDGLELAAWIGEEHPEVRTILLTGHDEFEYAQEAVRLHVRDFLLKPITADELRAVLDNVRADLDGAARRREQVGRLQDQLAESLPLLRERFLNRLIAGYVSAKEVQRRRTLLDLDLDDGWFAAVVCDLDATARSDALVPLALAQLAAGQARDGEFVFATQDDMTVIIVAGPERASCAANALARAELVSSAAARDLDASVSIGVGDPVSTIEHVTTSFSQALGALERRFLLGSDRIITAEETAGSVDNAADAGERAFRDRFVRSIRTGETERSRSALRDLFDGYRTRGADRDECLVSLQRLLADTLTAVEALGLNRREIDLLRPNPFERLSSLKTLEQMELWFEDVETATRSLLETRRDDLSQRKAAEAVSYIKSHYNEPDLALSRVCSALSVSKSYLSPVFKAHTGMTFVEYVTSTRMERACELLAHDDMKAYEIATLVGYRDAHYFSITFRKQTGETPTEYRARARRQPTEIVD